MRKVFAGALAPMLCLVLCLVLFPAGRAQLLTVQKMGAENTGQDLYVNLRMETTGEATLNAWSRNGGGELTQLLPQVLHCQDGRKAETTGRNAIRCSQALQREGLALEAVLDLAPIARALNGSTGIELFVGHPRLGFDSSSVVMTDDGDGPYATGTARFEAGTVPAPIRIRFGYHPDQLVGVYLPLLALALALTLIATIMSRAGYAPMALSAILLGTMVWMGAASQLQADAPLRILLFGSPLANFAALFLNLWPPLFCVAAGVALGSRMRGGKVRRTFGEVFWAYAVIPLILTCVVGALPSMTRGNWLPTAGWLLASPIFLLARRAWNRARARSSTRQLPAGELKERVSALAVRAGCPQVKVYISSSANSQAANAFALPGRTIFLTAPLVRLLSKREVDAVAAHELSHVRHSNRGLYMALCFAMLLWETPVWETLYTLPGGLVAAMLLPIVIFLAALRGSRKREFRADAGAAALTGDPRAMISSLARISRNNDSPLEMNALVVWFSSHPSTATRIKALAAAARLEATEVETLCSNNDPGEHYEIPAQQGGPDLSTDLFTPAWQRTNAGIYGWLVVFGSCGAGILVACLLESFTGFGIAPVLAGIVLGCLLTKGATAAAMSRSYGRLRQKLVAKLGVDGQIVGLAPECEARIYGSYRFSDAGLLRFENGRLFYQSERVEIALNPLDVVEVGMVAAAPSNWFRRQPMLRFRDPESGQVHGFILHTVDWLAAQRKLSRSIERWRARETSPESTSIRGFNPVAGETFRNPTIAAVARGFLVVGGIALAIAIATCLILRFDWPYVAWALVVTAGAYTSMLLPSMLYRPPSLPPAAPSPVETN
jgi:Zn-dependent protease with chaperone function